MDMFIKIFLSTLCCCWTIAALIYYRKYREAEAQKNKWFEKYTSSSKSNYVTTDIITNLMVETRELNAEIQDWKAKYLDLLEQNLRLAERINGESDE